MTNYSSSPFRKPIVGVLIRETQINKFLRQQPPKRLVVLKNANEKVNVTLYFFSMARVRLKSKSIKGVYFNKTKGIWQTKIFPYPNVLYKKCGWLKESKTDIFKKQLADDNARYLNYTNGFNKWEVYKILSQHKAITPHLPSTILFSSPGQLKEQIEKVGKIYLKGCNGGRGRQIVCVTKLANGYQYSYYIDKLYIFNVATFDQLMTAITAFYKDKKFLIQNAIDLVTIGTSIVDMRAEVQRDGNGNIVLAALPVRLSNPNAPITTHANSYTFENFFENFLNYPSVEIVSLKQKIMNLLVDVYKYLEAHYGEVGELGIDIGLDKKGQLWFIESNSRSLKVSLFKAYKQNIIKASYINLLEYSKYLYKNKKPKSLA